MTFIILDPNLTGGHGHHLGWDLAIASAAIARGERVTIYANRGYGLGGTSGVDFIPHFTHTTYERRSPDPFSAEYDDFEYFNAALAAELAALNRQLRPKDIVLVPTTSENHLLGYVRWMRTFARTEAPDFVVLLMFPTGLTLVGDEAKIADPFRVLFYRLAFRKAEEEGPEIRLYAGGRQLGVEYSVLAGTAVPPHAIPFAPKRRTSLPNSGARTALLFAGDAKPDKGFLLLPELADRLCAAHPDWRFVIHANTAIGGKGIQMSFDALTGLAAKHPNLTVHGGRLSQSAYETLLESADWMVFPYDPAAYAGKSSAVLWECVSLGIPVVVPKGGWLEKEAALWGAGCQPYEPHSVEAIDAAVSAMGGDLGRHLTDASMAAAEAYQAVNGGEALLRQLRGEAPSSAVQSSANKPPPVDDAIVQAADIKLVQRLANDRFRLLDIVLSSVSAGRVSWPRLKFKFVSGPKGCGLEFRQQRGWPVMFATWPSSESDRFGPVLRLPNDREKLRGLLATWSDAGDRRLLRALAGLLASAVRAALGQTELPDAERETWHAEAKEMAERLGEALAMTGGDSRG